MNTAILSCRLFLILSLAAGLWMADCAGELSVAHSVQEQGAANGLSPELKAALGGCHGPGIPAQVTGSLAAFALLLPTSADRAEFGLGLSRDYLFIGAYTLGYLSLMSLLRLRAGRFPGRQLAHAAFLLILITAACDIGENYYTSRVLTYLSARDDQKAPPVQQVSVTDVQKAAEHDVHAKQWCSYGKWLANSALSMVLAFVFLEWHRPWQIFAGGLLFLGGLSGLALGLVRPVFIEGSFLAAFVGSLVGMVILLGTDSDNGLWDTPSE